MPGSSDELRRTPTSWPSDAGVALGSQSGAAATAPFATAVKKLKATDQANRDRGRGVVGNQETLFRPIDNAIEAIPSCAVRAGSEPGALAGAFMPLLLFSRQLVHQRAGVKNRVKSMVASREVRAAN